MVKDSFPGAAGGHATFTSEDAMAKRETGRYESTSAGGEQVRAFVPHALPPADPPILIEGALAERVRAAEQALVRLELAGEMVPSLDWFIYAFVRKEAVLSSQIEGTQATLMDLLEYEAGNDAPSPNADVEEVCNYLDALIFARKQLADPSGLPLSMRLLNETHRILLRGVRGENKQPGEVRRSQNWIGGSRPGNAVYVPPPPNALPEVLSALERTIHADDALPPVVRAGLLHVQFETIHPYLDGNGRIGRLLVTLLFEHWRLLTRPLLYLSLFFKRHRTEYYRRLNAVRVGGDWEAWLDFFLDGVATIADEAVATARDLFALVTADRQRVIHHGAVNLLAVQLFERLPSRPITTAPWVVDALSTTKPTAGRAIEALLAAGVLVETTGKKRDRVYAYQAYLDRLRAGTDLGGEE
jgi:Fic family protein